MAECGTTNGYAAGCRCEQCSEASAAYHRSYQVERRRRLLIERQNEAQPAARCKCDVSKPIRDEDGDLNCLGCGRLINKKGEPNGQR